MSHPAYGQFREVAPFASVLLADNPSIMTLDGTNSWVLRAPGASASVVVDPGPHDTVHLAQLADAGAVELILVTHHHGDHTGGMAAFASRVRAPVRAFDPSWCLRGPALCDGETLEAGGLELRIMHTPGHTSDSISVAVQHDGASATLTGDTVLGRGTTVIAHPDGTLGEYLDSLRRLADCPQGTLVLPGHGPELPDLAATAHEYLAHREQRLDQVRAALAQLGPDASPREVVEVVYADVDPALWGPAEYSVRAQLEYLRG
ncbi:MBL fold metallo-hydrolase [Herbihabitans rhizosphaerae]|uniref:MBL fold metallo-hydrolase n=1 Tax=Herbihabitans rhizosphaerae TaxID=1872711 RepID=UPI00102B6203|nr:MBL fold metallo-hydrolase [Herbihabitans rhizosphaerae]